MAYREAGATERGGCHASGGRSASKLFPSSSGRIASWSGVSGQPGLAGLNVATIPTRRSEQRKAKPIKASVVSSHRGCSGVPANGVPGGNRSMALRAAGSAIALQLPRSQQWHRNDRGSRHHRRGNHPKRAARAGDRAAGSALHFLGGSADLDHRVSLGRTLERNLVLCDSSGRGRVSGDSMKGRKRAHYARKWKMLGTPSGRRHKWPMN